MINFLTAEYSKLLKRKNFYIALTLMILTSLANLILFFIFNDLSVVTESDMQEIMIRLVSNKFMAIIMVFMTTVFLAGTNGHMVKNAITIGYSRIEIYFAKLFVGGTILLVLLFTSMVTTMAFCGIWLNNIFTIDAFWFALARFALAAMLYLALFTISLTLCYILNSNTLFAIVYFIIFLVCSEIISTIAAINSNLAYLQKLTITYQLASLQYADNSFPMWPYIIGITPTYTIITAIIGSVIVNRKDIK